MKRISIFLIVVALLLATLLASTMPGKFSDIWLWISVPLGLFALLGLWDLLQKDHALFRNYPIVGRLRPILESVRPQIRQYFIESDTDGMPFSREQRALIYQRSKSQADKAPFGTELRVRAEGYEWLNHAICPVQKSEQLFRVTIGGKNCRQAYSASVFNISAMSFGSLSANAILALNEGARLGNFAHDTGEGGLSPYHLKAGGDIVWEIGSGYFSCRDMDGNFDPQIFADRARQAQVKMIEIKLSQGAKPGHGGILPAAKVSAEIAGIRGVQPGVDCLSPSAHSAFQTPIGLLQFVERLRQLSDGKPIGFKLCIGHPWEFLAICKAMVQTGILPDFIVVDGKEGGTGAAPLEFSDHVGTPLREGLLLVHNALTAIGVRDEVRVGASGKIVSGFDIAITMALGADWCNAARGFMFSLGCLQSQKCHTDRCPVGIATQNKSRQRGLVVETKAQRVRNFHRATVTALAELIAAAGLQHPSSLQPSHFFQRQDARQVLPLSEVYEFSDPRELLGPSPKGQFTALWDRVSAEHF